MTSKTTHTLSYTRVAPLARIVALLLLVLVTRAATVEVIHQHGNLLPAKAAVASTVCDAQTNNSTGESSPSTGECLSCQLHQNLFSALLLSIPVFAPPLSQETQVATTLFPVLSETRTLRRGRAPPETTLL